MRKARPGFHGELFSVSKPQKISRRIFYPQRLSRRDSRRTFAGGGVSKNRRRWVCVDRTNSDSICRAWKKFWRQFPRRLRRRVFVLACVAFLAVADSRGGLSDSRLDCVERVRRALFRNLDVAARRENRRGQLGATKSLVVGWRGDLGRARNDPCSFPRRFS